MKIRNQRPRKPAIENFHPNQANVDILIRHIGSTILISKILSADSTNFYPIEVNFYILIVRNFESIIFKGTNVNRYDLKLLKLSFRVI